MKRLLLYIHDHLSRTAAWLLLVATMALCCWGATRLTYDEDITHFLPSDPMTQHNALLADSLRATADSIAALHPGLAALFILVILALLLYHFRSLRPLCLSALALAWGWVFALGMMGLMVQHISLIVLGVGSVIVGLAVDYPLHFLSHLRHESSHRDTLMHLARPLAVGWGTTVCSFLSLLLLKAEALQQLGIFGALVLTGTLLFVLIFLPLVAPRTVKAKAEPTAVKINPRGWMRTVLFLAVCALTVLFWFTGKNTQFDSDVPADNFCTVGWLCSAMVFCFLWLAFRRLELAMTAFLPLVVSWVWITGIMGLLGLQFNIVSVILATFIFGQGADYTVFMTDGLLTRYRTGRDTLTAYRSAIRLLALTTLAGIGTLVVARHPAMHSLGVVALIGMSVVVGLCLYLPPVLFRWALQGRVEPVTLPRLLRSLYAITAFLVGILLLWPVLLWMRYVGRGDEQHRMRFHRLLWRVSRFVIARVPDTTFKLSNECGETFQRPAIIICNHQSHLDLMAVMALTPRLIVLTNDWVWHNPFYGHFIHFAEFYPVSGGVENTLSHVRNLMERGYSVVVFPEGTRSADGRIGRFHKGAFTMARMLECDVVEVMIHGLGHVLPKRDFMLRTGHMEVRVLRRFTVSADTDDRLLAQQERKRYITEFERWHSERR